MTPTKFLVAVVLLGNFFFSTNALCEKDWESFGNNCYKFVPEAGVNQHEALLACKKMGGASLVSVHSLEEHKFIIDHIKSLGKTKESFWTGLELRHASKTDKTLVGCYWIDGSAFDYGECKFGIGKEPWSNGEPHDEKDWGEFCVAYYGVEGDEGWADYPCDTSDFRKEKLGYICKK